MDVERTLRELYSEKKRLDSAISDFRERGRAQAHPDHLPRRRAVEERNELEERREFPSE